jgi:hypothetical protein
MNVSQYVGKFNMKTRNSDTDSVAEVYNHLDSCARSVHSPYPHLMLL